jgi:hypothetical protein
MNGNGNGTTTTTSPLKIIEFRARNIKRLNAVEIRPGDASVVLMTGKNRQGKSSVLDSIRMTLGGKGEISSKPIRDGAEDAECSLDLGDYLVTRKFTASGEYLNITTKDGFKAPKPQEFLNSRMAGRAYNPLEFMRLSASEQTKALQSFVSLKLDLDELETISGLPTKDKNGAVPEALLKLDPVEALEMVYKRLYNKRADANKEVKRLEGAHNSVEIPEGCESLSAVNVQDLVAALKEITKVRAQNEKVRESVGARKHELDLIDGAIVNKDINILDLQKRIDKLNEEKGRLIIDKEKKAVQVDEATKAVAALVDPDSTELDKRIADADETNRIAGMVTEKKKLKEELVAAKELAHDYHSKLNAVTEYKTRLIQEAGLPVPGLGFENGEVTFNSIPLSQASGREQIEISCAICAAHNPSIAVLTIDSGWNELDKEGKEALENFARARGLQIWCCSVQEEPGDTGFHIFDGSVVAIDGHEPFVQPVHEHDTNNDDSNIIGLGEK